MADPNLQQGGDVEFRKPSKTASLVGVLLILVSVAGYTFFTRSLSEKVSTIDSDIASKETQIVDLENQIAQFETAEEELGISTEVARLEAKKSIPKGINEDDVIRNVIEISDTNDVELNSLSFGKGSTNQEGILSLRVNASFEGNFNDLINFLKSIEQNARLFVVNSISVQLSRIAISDIQRANFTLAMETYYQQ